MNPALLEVKGLCKDFGGLRAVDGVDFQIREGEVFSIIGPNGSGKTTIFNLITGFHPATGGMIFFGGEEITNLKPFAVARKGIARTFQLTWFSAAIRSSTTWWSDTGCGSKRAFWEPYSGADGPARRNGPVGIRRKKSWNSPA